MDKKLIAAAGLVLVIGGLALGLVVGLVANDGGGSDSTKLPNTITVQGAASVSTAPDLAVLRLGVRAEGDTAEAAFTAGDTKAKAVRAALIDAGVDAADIQTRNLDLRKKTENRDTPSERTFYQSSQDFEIKVQDVDTAGAVAGSAVAAGANVVGGIEFQLSDKAPSREDALAEAVKGARSKADVMASAAGATVGDVIVIDETNTTYESYDQPLAWNAFSADVYGGGSTDAAYRVAPGEVETRVEITVVYELQPA